MQLRSIGNAMTIASGQGVTQTAMIFAAGLLALFAVLFEARRYEVARRSVGPVFPRFFRAEQTVSDLPSLVDLTASFIGRERAEIEFPNAAVGKPVDRNSARRAQDLIARVVGASSARALVTSALAGGTMSLPEVTRLLDEGGQSLRFSRQLLASTFENIDAGISVVDAELNLMAWNTRYLDLFDYPVGLGHRALGAATITEALAQCGEADAILADYQLDDGEDGLNLIAAIRQQRPGLPVRLITAESGTDMRARARAMGVDALAKPVDPAEITRLLAAASMLKIKP